MNRIRKIAGLLVVAGGSVLAMEVLGYSDEKILYAHQSGPIIIGTLGVAYLLVLLAMPRGKR